VPLLPVPPLLPPLLLLGLLVLHGCSSRLRPNNGGTPAELLAAATSRRSAGDSAAAILGRLRRRLGFANDRRKSKGKKWLLDQPKLQQIYFAIRQWFGRGRGILLRANAARGAEEAESVRARLRER
jgi:hypothetical protein